MGAHQPMLAQDLFFDSLIDASIKDDMALMSHPFFSLKKQANFKPMIYDDGTARIEIRPGDKGIATIWDKDILLYITTLVNSTLEKGEPVSQIVRFNAYDLLRTTRRSTGKRGYQLLFDALYRLRSTSVITSIESGEQKERTGFGWIDNFKVIERTDRRGRKVMGCVEVTLCDWMFRAIIKDRRILTINSDYFGLTRGLERRLYELARKHVGRQMKWTIGLEKLAAKCGTEQDLRRFKDDLKGIVKANNLPDYKINTVFDPKDPAQAQDRPRGRGRGRSKSGQMIVVFTPKLYIPQPDENGMI